VAHVDSSLDMLRRRFNRSVSTKQSQTTSQCQSVLPGSSWEDREDKEHLN